MTERRCPRCGALAAQTAEWCGQCYMHLEPDESVRSEFRHADAAPNPFPKYEYSRTGASATTFGVTGRVIATLLTCVLPILWFLYVGVIGAAIVWAVIVWPIAIPSIWKKARKPTIGGK